jgi:hypothetical protein
MKFERFLFVSNHSTLPRDVHTCCCCLWLSFTAVTVLYSPWLPWETRCKKKSSNLFRSIKVAKECTYLILLNMVFLQCSDSAVFTLATLEDTIKFEMFLFVSHHSRLPRNVPTCCCCVRFPSLQGQKLYLPWLPRKTLHEWKCSNMCWVIQGYQGIYITFAIMGGFLLYESQSYTCLG